MMRITETVKQLIIINIMFFIGTYLVGEPVHKYLALYPVQNDNFQFWQLLTHMFMHGGLMHILFNMFALFSFGGLLEQAWGAKKFIFFYISCGLGAAALHLGITYLEIQYILQGVADLNLSSETIHQILNATTGQEIFETVKSANKAGLLNDQNFETLINAAKLNQVPAVGASGAIYGILVAFAFMVPNAELMMMFIPIPVKAKYFVPGLLAFDLFMGLRGQSIFGGSSDGVAHFAHIGGALIGFIMMWYWKKNEFNNNRWN